MGKSATTIRFAIVGDIHVRKEASGTLRNFFAQASDAADALFLFDRASATWMIADRWRASTNWAHSALSRERAGSRKFAFWNLSHLAELHYQLEDAWALSASWQHTQSHGRTSFAREDAFALGVSYQLFGRFAAPGLLEPMHLEPPNR